MIALKSDNFLNLISLVQNEVNSKDRPSFFEKIVRYFFSRRVRKKSERINTLLSGMLNQATSPSYVATQESYISAKKLLIEIKQLNAEVLPYALPSKILALSETNLSLAYEIEKSIRINYFTHHPTREVSPLTRAVALSSQRTTFSKI